MTTMKESQENVVNSFARSVPLEILTNMEGVAKENVVAFVGSIHGRVQTGIKQDEMAGILLGLGNEYAKLRWIQVLLAIRENSSVQK